MISRCLVSSIWRQASWDAAVRSESETQTTSDSGWHARSGCECSCLTISRFGEITAVLAKHSKDFSVEDALSIGMDRMQRNFEPMRRQVQSWRAQPLSTEAEKLTIYRAFIERELEVPRH